MSCGYGNEQARAVDGWVLFRSQPKEGLIDPPSTACWARQSLGSNAGLRFTVRRLARAIVRGFVVAALRCVPQTQVGRMMGQVQTLGKCSLSWARRRPEALIQMVQKHVGDSRTHLQITLRLWSSSPRRALAVPALLPSRRHKGYIIGTL